MKNWRAQGAKALRLIADRIEAGYYHSIEFDHNVPTRILENPAVIAEEIEYSGEENITIKIHRNADPIKC